MQNINIKSVKYYNITYKPSLLQFEKPSLISVYIFKFAYSKFIWLLKKSLQHAFSVLKILINIWGKIFIIKYLYPIKQNIHL